MKKFFTSLIAFAVLLCAIGLATACGPTSSSGYRQSASGQSKIPVRADAKSVPVVRESSREAVAIKTETLPVTAATGRRSNFKRLKTDTPKRVNPEIQQTFYEEPPDIRAYNGIGFANQVRAQPQIE